MSHSLEAILLLIKDLNSSDLSIVKTKCEQLLGNTSFPCRPRILTALSAPSNVPEEDNFDSDSSGREPVTREQLDRELDEIEHERLMYYKLREELLYHFKLI